MKKFLNAPGNFVDDMLAGILAAHPDQLRKVGDDQRCVIRARPGRNKVALVSGGGSGHLPLFMGYVGQGLLDGCAVGGVFQSPSAEQWYQTGKAAEAGKGILYIYGNYTGDIMNYEMAKEMLDADGIPCAEVRGFDDVASAPKGEEGKRRGVAGIFFVYKCAGAKAEQGAGFEEVKAVAEKAGSRVRTMGVALSPCIIPEAGKPGFTLGEDEMEIGMGIHGEPGVRRGKLQPADAVVDEMLAPILADQPLAAGDEVAVLVNGLGATPKEELYIVYRRLAERLAPTGAKVFKTYVGEFATSMEMTGFSISILKLDAELKDLLAQPARTPFFEQSGP
ncbi:MAG: dihydroxyacetone kinase subunit DhaK [Planctomycetota bacterium]|jgi:dihydroxyacetone kinase-like protein|nr:dihydroxyacetone kinase subunit DhaK [Planctomycetota bacterium]